MFLKVAVRRNLSLKKYDDGLSGQVGGAPQTDAESGNWIN